MLDISSFRLIHVYLVFTTSSSFLPFVTHIREPHGRHSTPLPLQCVPSF